MIEKGTTWIKHTGRFALDGYFRLEEQSTAITGLTPIANNLHLYAKDKSGVTELFYKNSAGTERDFSTPIAHTILSTSHSDTVAGTVVRGDVIVGNSTPAWERLARGATSQLLQINSSGDAEWTTPSVTVGTAGTAFTGGTAGSVLFIASGPVVQQDNANFFWDNSLNRLGIGTIAPSAPVEIYRTATTDPALLVNSTSSVGLSFRLGNSVSSSQLFIAGATNDFIPGSVAGNGGFRVGSSASLLFGTSAALWIKVFPTGQMVLNSNTITSATIAEKNIASAPTFNGSGEAPICLDMRPTFTPSATINEAISFFCQGTFNPPTGVTISNAENTAFRVATGNDVGVVTKAVAIVAFAPSLGTLKPITNIGVEARVQGAVGVTNGIGMQILAQAGATNNYDLSFGTVDTTAAGAYYGRVPILYNGLLKYLHVFSA